MRVRMPDGTADEVMLRYVCDGEPRTVTAVVDEQSDGETWWRASLPVENPVRPATGGSSRAAAPATRG